MSNNITIVRVETEDGVGAYQNGDAADEAMFGDYHYNPGGLPPFKTHPSPYRDSTRDEWVALHKARDQENWYFGFADVAQLLQWWNTPEALKLLESGGLLLREYECEPGTVITGRKQIIFRRSNATRGQAIRLSTLMSHKSIQYAPIEIGDLTQIEERLMCLEEGIPSDNARLQGTTAKFGRSPIRLLDLSLDDYAKALRNISSPKGVDCLYNP